MPRGTPSSEPEDWNSGSGGTVLCALRELRSSLLPLISAAKLAASAAAAASESASACMHENYTPRLGVLAVSPLDKQSCSIDTKCWRNGSRSPHHKFVVRTERSHREVHAIML
jgi:hypothetical protein